MDEQETSVPDFETEGEEDEEQDLDGMVEVILPSGSKFPVYVTERDYILDRATLYQEQNKFQNVSDLQDLDRLIIFETQVYRLSNFISRGKDYWGTLVDVDEVQGWIKNYSNQISVIKKQIGIDKVSRDKAKGDEEVSTYINNLLRRAMQFGIHRNNQVAKAMELFADLQKLVTLHDNCDELERKELEVNMEDIFKWIKEDAIPEYRKLDDDFRKEQKIWIKTL